MKVNRSFDLNLNVVDHKLHRITWIEEPSFDLQISPLPFQILVPASSEQTPISIATNISPVLRTHQNLAFCHLSTSLSLQSENTALQQRGHPFMMSTKESRF